MREPHSHFYPHISAAALNHGVLGSETEDALDYKDYYATLGVDRKASQDDIQKAYRKLARKYHPDVNTSTGAEDKFKEVTEAYEVLKDADKRRTYDQFGHNWKQRGGPPPGWQNVGFDFGGGGSGFSDFFESLFGGAGRASAGPGQGPFGGFGGFGGGFGGPNLDQEVTLALTLEEAAKGGQRQVTIRDQSGQAQSFSVNLPAGVKEGQKLRLQGKGLEGPNGQKGDLFLKIDFRPHAKFKLDGRNLQADLPISPWVAALGGEASVRTLDGTIRVKVPAGSSSGRKIRLRSKGYPNPKGQDGDLIVELKIMVPESLTDEERRLFEELAETSEFKPRS